MSGHERERLSAYLDGELPAGERAEVSAHLVGCLQCASRLSEMAALDERARELPQEAPPGYFDTLPGRVRARLERSSTGRPPAPARRRKRLPTWTWAAAAALILGVVTPLTLRELDQAAPKAPPQVDQDVLGRLENEPAPAPAETLEGLTASRDEVPTAAVERREASRPLRAQEAEAKPEPSFAPAPATLSPPPSPKRVGGKADTSDGPVADPPRPPELPKDTEGFSRSAPAAMAEADVLEEKVAGSPETTRREAAMTADALPSRALAQPALGGTTAPVQSQAAAAPGETGRRRQSRSDEKAIGDEDDSAFDGLDRGNLPGDAAGWRERREAWRTLVVENPEGPRSDEARVRVIEAGLQAWRMGGASEDLERAREDAAAYLERDDAELKQRVQRALESAERE